MIKSGDFSEDVLLLGGDPWGQKIGLLMAGVNLNSDFLPDELELREGHDSLGRDSAKFYKILNKRVQAFKIIVIDDTSLVFVDVPTIGAC